MKKPHKWRCNTWNSASRYCSVEYWQAAYCERLHSLKIYKVNWDYKPTLNPNNFVNYYKSLKYWQQLTPACQSKSKLWQLGLYPAQSQIHHDAYNHSHRYGVYIQLRWHLSLVDINLHIFPLGRSISKVNLYIAALHQYLWRMCFLLSRYIFRLHKPIIVTVLAFMEDDLEIFQGNLQCKHQK